MDSSLVGLSTSASGKALRLRLPAARPTSAQVSHPDFLAAAQARTQSTGSSWDTTADAGKCPGHRGVHTQQVGLPESLAAAQASAGVLAAAAMQLQAQTGEPGTRPRAHPAGCTPERRMLVMMGKQKAAVLPDPVWAQAIRSRPARPMGMLYRCTGVGLTYLQRFTLAASAGPRSTSWKVVIGSGTCMRDATGWVRACQ